MLEKKTNEEKALNSINKKRNKKESKYFIKKRMKKRIKNSQVVCNVKFVDDDGLINLKTGEVCSLIEIGAIDLSLTSNQEKNNFFFALKSLYQIRGLNLKCYKVDDKINLNSNKVNLENKIAKCEDSDIKKSLLEESKNLIEHLEENNFTVSSRYYWVIIAKTVEELEKILDEVEDELNNITPKIKYELIQNKLEIYKFLSNLYLTSNSLDQLV